MAEQVGERVTSGLLGVDDARLRVGLLVYAGIGFAHGAQALPPPTAEDLIDFLAGDAGVKGS